MSNKQIKCVVAILAIVMSSLACQAQKKVRVGLAWQPNPSACARVIQSIEISGGEAVVLGQVRPDGFDYDSTKLQAKYVDQDGVLLPIYAQQLKRDTWHSSNAAQVLEGVDAVVFLGGGDISSTLFRNPQPWHGIAGDYCNATRDISEYLTMTYCLDHDIPVLGLCRGMQMLAVASGADMIQDLGVYFDQLGKQYLNLHRSLRDENGNRHYTPHDVVVTDHSSLIYEIALDFTLAVHDRSWLIHKVNHTATFLAIEMDMGVGVTIIADSMFVYRNHQSRLALREQAKCVIDGCPAQRFDLRAQSLIDLLNCRMSEMSHQIRHNLNALNGWLDTTFH